MKYKLKIIALVNKENRGTKFQTCQLLLDDEIFFDVNEAV